MGLVIESNVFEIFDVSGIEIENRLTFEKSDDNVVPRNEDEAFIREFIAERGFGKIGSDKICPWPTLNDWISIVWAVGEMQHAGWVRTELLEKPEDIQDVVEPDPKRDDVTEKHSYFKSFDPLERYVETTGYKYEEGKQNEAWSFPDPYLGENQSMSGVKRMEDFANIYKDFAAMNGIWISPRGSIAIRAKAKLKFDDIKYEEKYKWSVENIEANAYANGTATIENDGTVTPNQALIAEYVDANGSERSTQVSTAVIWRESCVEKEIYDGRDADGNVKRKKVRMYDKTTVDIELDYEDTKYGEDEKEWDLKAGAVLVNIKANFVNFSTLETENKYSQIIVKCKVEDKKMIIDDEFREKVSSYIPTGLGERTLLEVWMDQFGSIADIKWNTRLKHGTSD